MTPEQLVENIIKIYRKCSDSTPCSYQKQVKLKRITNHTASSMIEDQIAAYISSKLDQKRKFTVYIDPQITVRKRKGTIRPDICIIDDAKNECVACFDIKNDLGYKRDSFFNFCKACKERDRLIQGKEAIFHTEKKDKDRLIISENIFKDAVTGIGWANIKTELLKNKLAENFGEKEVRLRIRLKQKDYRKIFNEYGKEVKEAIEHPYRKITISNKLRSCYIIVSPLNIAPEKLESHKNKLHSAGIPVYILLNKTHPNSRGRESETINDLNDGDIKLLNEYLQKL